MIEEHLSDKVTNFIHGRPDCTIFPYVNDPKLYCEKCFCCKCQKSASVCKFWNKHCYITKIEKLPIEEKVGDEKKRTTSIKKGKEKHQESEKKKAVGSSIKKHDLLNNYQKRAEEAEAALKELKDSLRSVLNMNEDELKVICKEKDVKVFGRASGKHTYVCAYLNHLV